MADEDAILISLRPRHAENVFSGLKSVEFRKRRPDAPANTLIWIYATVPTGEILGSAKLETIVTETPSKIWELYGSRSAITKSEFDEYFLDRTVAHAIILKEIKSLVRPVSLGELRAKLNSFHPPQFFLRLNGAATELRLSTRKVIKVKRR